MNANAQKWIDALLSGEFAQTTHRLRDGTTNAFCCLGVACEVYRRETGQGQWTEDGVFITEESRSEKVLPIEVSKWYKIEDDDENPVIFFYKGGAKEYTNLAYENDKGMSFADLVELIKTKVKFVEGDSDVR